MVDAISQFRNAIQTAGLEPPETIEPGKLHRFPGFGKRPTNRAGWCLLFDDGLGGCFGDWSTGLCEYWRPKRNRSASPAERGAFAHRLAAAGVEAEAKRRARQAKAASRAARLWHAASPAPGSHPYLIRKGIAARGARLHKGALVLPVMDFTCRLTSLQFINADGRKRLLSGGRKQGCFIPATDSATKPTLVVICEGWATGCTLAGDVPAALVLAAIDAGNLSPVAVQARRRWPTAELVVAGDDDRLTPGNPGATQAREAARAAEALLALPQWPVNAPKQLTDFNDLAKWLAGGAV